MALFKTNNDVLAPASKLKRFGYALNLELQYPDGYHNGSPDNVDR